jgi:hypothetical protein
MFTPYPLITWGRFAIPGKRPFRGGEIAGWAGARRAGPCPAWIPAHTCATDRGGDSIRRGALVSTAYSPIRFLRGNIFSRCRRARSAFPPVPGDPLNILIGSGEKNFIVFEGFSAPEPARRGVPRAPRSSFIGSAPSARSSHSERSCPGRWRRTCASGKGAAFR